MAWELLLMISGLLEENTIKNNTKMKLQVKSALFTLIVAFGAVAGVQAQCSDWKYPDDKSTADEKIVLYTDAVKNSNFLAAVKPHRWLLQNAPDLNTSLYINGVKIFQGLADEEQDDAKRKEWVDSLMMMYDMRMQYCGEREEVLTRKAYDAYKYKIKNTEQLPELLELYDEVYEELGNKVGYYITLPYMSIIYYTQRIHKSLTEEGILQRYDNLNQIMDSKIQKGGSTAEKVKGYKPRIDGMLVEIVDVDCDFVRKNLGPKLEENPDDLNLAKKIFGFMLAGKCTDDPLWLEAAKLIEKNEPEYGLAKNIALKEISNGNLETAEQYLKEALELTEDPSNKAEVYMSMGKLKQEQGSYSGAREMYYKAVQADPSQKEAYSSIGMLYYNSFSICKEEQDPVKDRAVFLAAYDMFQKAGNSRMMQSAQEQFPSKDEIFTYNYSKGGTVSTGCWIGESTTIRSRD